MSTAAVTRWLSHRRERQDAPLDLAGLLTVGFRDKLHRRKAELQIESVTLDVAERIQRVFATEIGVLPENESAAAALTVRDIFVQHVIKDEALFAADARAELMIDQVRPHFEAELRRASLSDGATFLAEQLMTDSVRCYIELTCSTAAAC